MPRAKIIACGEAEATEAAIARRTATRDTDIGLGSRITPGRGDGRVTAACAGRTAAGCRAA